MIFNQTEIAEIHGVTTRTIQNWIKNKDFPVEHQEDGRDMYDAKRTIRWRIDYERGSSLDEERTRLTKEQADKTEMENQVRRGELVEMSTITGEIGEYTHNLKTGLLALPAKLSPYLEHKATDEIEGQLADAIHDCLSELVAQTQRIADAAAEVDGQ